MSNVCVVVGKKSAQVVSESGGQILAGLWQFSHRIIWPRVDSFPSNSM